MLDVHTISVPGDFEGDHCVGRDARKDPVSWRRVPGQGFERRTTLTLPEAVGDRALIIYGGACEFRTLVIPPARREAVRALLLPIRSGDRRQPPPLTYGSAVCDAVARYLRDVPRRDRC